MLYSFPDILKVVSTDVLKSLYYLKAGRGLPLQLRGRINMPLKSGGPRENQRQEGSWNRYDR